MAGLGVLPPRHPGRSHDRQRHGDGAPEISSVDTAPAGSGSSGGSPGAARAARCMTRSERRLSCEEKSFPHPSRSRSSSARTFEPPFEARSRMSSAPRSRTSCRTTGKLPQAEATTGGHQCCFGSEAVVAPRSTQACEQNPHRNQPAEDRVAHAAMACLASGAPNRMHRVLVQQPCISERRRSDAVQRSPASSLASRRARPWDVLAACFMGGAPFRRWGSGPAPARLGAPVPEPCSDTSARPPARWGCASRSADRRPPTS